MSIGRQHPIPLVNSQIELLSGEFIRVSSRQQNSVEAFREVIEKHQYLATTIISEGVILIAAITWSGMDSESKNAVLTAYGGCKDIEGFRYILLAAWDQCRSMSNAYTLPTPAIHSCTT